jgi:RNA polymerase sigma-70 factor (ECF subfamily)
MIVRRNAQAVTKTYEACAEEEVFLARLKVGDRDAVSQFVEENRQRIFSFVFSVLMNKEDAEDVTQETLIRAIEKIGTFNGDSSLLTWVLRIGRNAALDLKRKKSRRETVLDEDGKIDGGVCSLEEVASQAARNGSSALVGIGGLAFGSGAGGKNDGCPGELLRVKEKLALLNSILADISREHREVLVLREVDGLAYDEISEILGVSRGTVMSRLFYARKRVQQALASVDQVVEQESEGALQFEGISMESDKMETGKGVRSVRVVKDGTSRGGRFSFGRLTGLGLF